MVYVTLTTVNMNTRPQYLWFNSNLWHYKYWI